MDSVCPECGGVMAVMESNYEIWYSCLMPDCLYSKVVVDRKQKLLRFYQEHKQRYFGGLKNGKKNRNR